MKEYLNPILNKEGRPEQTNYQPQPTEVVREQAKKERAFQLYLRQRRQALYDRYMRWMRRENPMVDAMGRWVMGDVTRNNPDPTFRLRRRHYLSQKWRELRMRNSSM
jgi:hypothetical protein